MLLLRCQLDAATELRGIDLPHCLERDVQLLLPSHRLRLLDGEDVDR